MNYQETLSFLFNSLPMYQRTGKAAYKANLDNTIALDESLGHPHTKFKSIHIAGTNGKGSVSHILASILQAAGYKTGLYTSPHLLDFRERIRVDGKMIDDKAVVEFVKKIRKEIETISPSFFEMTVAMAFDHFAKEKVDIAIIETGLGGRLDSTNIIQPEIAVITSISIDHSEFLGNTIKQISREKGGIIKNNTPLITLNDNGDIAEVLSEISADKNAFICWANEIRKFKYQTFSIDQQALFHFQNQELKKEEIIKTDLLGSYQSENLALALATTDMLNKQNWNIDKANIASGLENVKKNTALLGRWEILGANPRIICDTAHNEAGIKAVVMQLEKIPCRELHIVWGMVNDKIIESILPLLPKTAIYYFTQASIPRSMPAEKLASISHEYGLSGNSYKLVDTAYRAALDAANTDDTVFIGGSTFIVADLLQILNN
ncbi:bifunctional folylpolyglutamate synthase/dihydrofolate synthase [Bacteroidota bacterium]